MTTLQSRLKNSVCLPATIDTCLPASIDEDFAIKYLATDVIPQCLHRLETKLSKEILGAIVQQKLREGRLPFTLLTVKFANEGDRLCDAALRLVFAEMVGGASMERGPGHLQVWAYGQRAVLQPHKRKPGRSWNDNIMRNVQICVLIDAACRGFGVSPTRNLFPGRTRAAHEANRPPSGISLVVDALKLIRRRGHLRDIHLNEANVQNNIWFGLAGEMVDAVYGLTQRDDMARGCGRATAQPQHNISSRISGKSIIQSIT
jgi:hypothetical protein